MIQEHFEVFEKYGCSREDHLFFKATKAYDKIYKQLTDSEIVDLIATRMRCTLDGNDKEFKQVCAAIKKRILG